jgi:hypothetical protein
MMNKEIVKAMNKKETKVDTMRKWWNKNGYKVMRVILFPIWWGMKAKEEITNKLNNKEVWNDEKANEILNYYIPRRAEWDAEDKTFYFFDNGYGWGYNSAKKYLNRKDRRFWRVNCTWGGKMRSYLINDFELEGFTKEVGNCWDGWTEVSFTMIEK